MMMKNALQKGKNKKFKTIARNLSCISDDHVKIVLKEYFKMCKLVYRLRSLSSVIWEQSMGNRDSVAELYFKNDLFITMVKMVQRSLVNIFSGTSPKEELVDLASVSVDG